MGFKGKPKGRQSVWGVRFLEAVPGRFHVRQIAPEAAGAAAAGAPDAAAAAGAG